MHTRHICIAGIICVLFCASGFFLNQECFLFFCIFPSFLFRYQSLSPDEQNNQIRPHKSNQPRHLEELQIREDKNKFPPLQGHAIYIYAYYSGMEEGVLNDYSNDLCRGSIQGVLFEWINPGDGTCCHDSSANPTYEPARHRRSYGVFDLTVQQIFEGYSNDYSSRCWHT